MPPLSSKGILYVLLGIIIQACQPQRIIDKAKTQEQLAYSAQKYSDDTLRGSETEFRDWWNVLHYDITFSPDYINQSIQGSVVMTFEMIQKPKHKTLQLDLQQPMEITEIVQWVKTGQNKVVTEKIISQENYIRQNNVYFINTDALLLKNNEAIRLQIKFKGKPKIAKQPPWDGGWVFTKDKKGRPWMSAAVQGLGASAWFPNKDYWGDEADHGVKISIIVPDDLVAVANGRLWESSFVKGDDGHNIYTWEVTNPINNYNIIPYIGYYKNFKDVYTNLQGKKLDLDYWVLDYNVDKAKKQFEQVKPMLSIFEEWMGPYPFYEDAYKMVEAPYLGMEHQSNIAYGNHFEDGYLGMDRSGTGWGNLFDYIIVHESGHEWFGNSITAKDPADMWIHEAFTTYSEAMYIENKFGVDAANAYVQGLKRNIAYDRPLVGKYGINQEGSGDMYDKGANMIHTLRQWMNDDIKFKMMIKAMNKQFYHQTVTSQQIETFISKYSGLTLDRFFDQYLRATQIPTLVVKHEGKNIYYKYEEAIEAFKMPIRLKGSKEWIHPTQQWQKYDGTAALIPDPNFLVGFNQR